MDLCSGTIEDMAEFDGCIYLTTTDDLFSFDSQRLRQVDVPLEGEKGHYTIDANSEALWIAGDECVLRFDVDDGTCIHVRKLALEQAII